MDTMEVEVDKTSLMDVDAGTKEAPLPAEAQAEPATNEPASAAAAAAAAAAPAADPASADSTSDSDDEPAETGTSGEGGGDAGGAGKSGASSKTPEEKLVKAVGYKDKGNACIAAGDSAGALKHYERGIKIVTSLGTTDEQAGTLLLSLRLNLALACTKEQRYQDAIAAAGKVLEVDGSNVKALFRRGVARARLGSLEDAKADFLAVIKADPRNGGAKKELKLVRDRLVEHRKKEKASYGGLFDKGPMYNDKEVERKKREAEALKRLKEEEAEWGRSNEQRKADGKEEQTLEDWRKEKKEAEEKAKKEREEKEKLKPRPPPAAPPKKASSGNSSSKDGGNGGGGDGEEMELDEDDLKIIQDTKKQGYCYFKRTLSDKDQKLLDAEQMKLRARVASPATISENDKGGGAVEADAAVRSAWNNAGTWEEMEKTEWCKGKLTEAFCKVEVTAGKDARTDPEFLLEKLGGFDFASAAGEGGGAGKGLEALSQLKQTLAKLRAKVTSVEIVEGDARVICVSNKIKHIFEFNAKVKFSLSIDESMGLQPQAEGDKAAKDTKTYKGTLEFPDLTNGDVDNGKFEVEPELKWDKGARWESTYDDRVKTCVAELKAGLLSALGIFFAEYKSS